MTTRRDFIRQCAGLAVAGAAAGPVLAQGSVQEGIDVSHWQGAINWASVAGSGKKFAFCKATEHTSYVDPTFATNYAAIKNNGMMRGAYHFGRPSFDPIKQARHFYKTVKPSSGDLPMVLDLEENDLLPPAQVKVWTQRFCAELTRKLGRAPLVYTGFYFWRDEAGNSPNNFGMQLWMPRWNVASPFPLPIAWSNWTFWQYSSTGSVPGITGDVDLDQFNGSLSALQGMGMP
jgi:lysozyme